MDKLQLILNSKVKMKLVQPNFICSGRKPTSCHYRGEVIKEDETTYTILFKHKNLLKEGVISKENATFVEEELEDIKII